jgi:hypothetical protein
MDANANTGGESNVPAIVGPAVFAPKICDDSGKISPSFSFVVVWDVISLEVLTVGSGFGAFCRDD